MLYISGTIGPGKGCARRVEEGVTPFQSKRELDFEGE
jgi:hypothetical protein